GRPRGCRVAQAGAGGARRGRPGNADLRPDRGRAERPGPLQTRHRARVRAVLGADGERPPRVRAADRVAGGAAVAGGRQGAAESELRRAMADDPRKGLSEEEVSAGGDARAAGVTRRGVRLGGGALGVAAAAAAGGYAVGDANASEGDGGGPAVDHASVVAFEGEHQAGVATPAQARLVFGSFDFVGTSARELQE